MLPGVVDSPVGFETLVSHMFQENNQFAQRDL